MVDNGDDAERGQSRASSGSRWMPLLRRCHAVPGH